MSHSNDNVENHERAVTGQGYPDGHAEGSPDGRDLEPRSASRAAPSFYPHAVREFVASTAPTLYEGGVSAQPPVPDDPLG